MTTPETTASPLHIDLFGPMQARVDGKLLPAMRSRKGLWLLALLTLRHDRPVEREWLAGTLWPDVEQTQAFANLRPILSELRSRLGTQSERLQSPTRHTLFLDLTGAEVDVLRFDAAVASKKLAELEQAVTLYRGPLLEGCGEEWVGQERAAREQDCLRALQKLGDAALAGGDYARALGYYQRAVTLDPLWEGARRGWMDALAKQGDRNAALQVYREFAELLRTDLRTVPDEQTTALYTRLRAETHKQSQVPAAEETAVVSAPRVAGYLPHPLTELVGREDERLEVAARLRRSRLVTLTGMGGMGKTRLALEVAREMTPAYANGVWLVALDALADSRQVMPQIAGVLGLKEELGRSLLDSVTQHLRGKRLLLVMDNCEHVLETSAPIVAHLLRECGELRILATSREALEITGEVAWAVPSLSVPDPAHLPEGQATLLRVLMGYEGVQLFVERAQAAQKTFNLTGSNARVVAQICFQLEGIPLALELAAARVKALTVEQIAAHLYNESGLLTRGNRVAQSRQQTLRATLDWSYALLTEPERALLRQLSVFAGGWTLEAAEALCEEKGKRRKEKAGAESLSPFSFLLSPDVSNLLASLVDKSLVVFEEREPETGGRYRLLEMVRQYAAAQWQAQSIGEPAGAEQLKARHRDYFLALVEEAETQLQGAKQETWLARLEAEHENLRAALAWCSIEASGAEKGLRLAGALWLFWDMRGHYSEGRAYLTDALVRTEAAGRTRERAKALNGAGVLTYYQGDYEAARALYAESLAISRELEDRRGLIWPLHHLGLMASRRGDYQEARELYEESLAISRELEDKQSLGWSVHQLGNVMREQGHYEQARELYEESLAINRELADKRGIAWSLNDLGKIAYDRGEYPAAQTLYEESLAVSRELKDKQGIAWSLHHLGSAVSAQGDYAQARMLREDSLAMFRELGDRQGMAWSLRHLGNLVSAQGDYKSATAIYEESLTIQRQLSNKMGTAWALNDLGRVAYEQGNFHGAGARYAESLGAFRELEYKRGIAEGLEGLAATLLAQAAAQRAARLWGAALAIRESIGTPKPSDERVKYDLQVGQARSILGEENFAAAWAEGCALTWEQAVSDSLRNV